MATSITDKFTKTESKRLYGDVKGNFQVHPGSKDLQLTHDVETIKSSIFNLLKTRPYERPFQPRLGSLVSYLLFENMDAPTMTFAKQMIEDTIQIYEPRAQLISVAVSPAADENGLYITIVYSVLNNDKPITIDLILDKVR
jgi:phage baseplate assembly protein W